jgi:hypothetical protein
MSSRRGEAADGWRLTAGGSQAEAAADGVIDSEHRVV